MLLRLTIGLLFIVVPMLELMLLVKIGQSIGVLPTAALVLATALTGGYIISRQSLAVVSRTLEALAEGRPPVEPVLDGLFLLVAGALLLTPGLLTDAAALVLLVPPLRQRIARAAMRWALRRTDVRVETYSYRHEGASHRPAGGGDGPIIDVELEPVDESHTVPGGNGPRRSDT